MNSVKFAAVVAAAVLVSGCATTKYYQVAGSEGFDTANYRCMQESQPSGSFEVRGSQNFVAGAMIGNAIAQGVVAHRVFKACMAAAGWAPGDAPSAPSAPVAQKVAECDSMCQTARKNMQDACDVGLVPAAKCNW